MLTVSQCLHKEIGVSAKSYFVDRRLDRVAGTSLVSSSKTTGIAAPDPANSCTDTFARRPSAKVGQKCLLNDRRPAGGFCSLADSSALGCEPKPEVDRRANLGVDAPSSSC